MLEEHDAVPGANGLVADDEEPWAARHVERRRERREPGNGAPVSVVYVNAGRKSPVTATLRDISVLGAGLNTSEPLREGSRIVLRLQTASEHRLVLCEVIYSRPAGDGSYRIGSELVDVVHNVNLETPIPGPWLG